jgi:hypothetical protein
LRAILVSQKGRGPDADNGRQAGREQDEAHVEILRVEITRRKLRALSHQDCAADHARPKFAPAIRRKLNLLNRLGRKSRQESVHVDIHKSANL